ncbi:MAG: ABC transporter permease [Bacteroidales bacterium]
MKNIFTIASKEFLETFRDRRTLVKMVLIPILIFPLIFTLVNSLQTSVLEKEQQRRLLTGIVNLDGPNSLVPFLESNPELHLQQMDDPALMEQLVREDSLQVGIVIQEGFEQQVNELGSGELTVFYSATKITMKDRLDQILEGYSSELLARRIMNQGLEPAFMHPVSKQMVNVASSREMVGKLAGGFLPYLFVLFCFMGAMYPAIDLFTGEKERKTLETLLTSPVSRLEIMVGKMMVIVATGIMSALLAILGLFLAVQVTAGMPEMISGIVESMLSLSFVLMMIAMLLPLTIFFAGIMIPIAIYSKTFKEAQSIFTPFTFLVIIPAVIGLMPGIELTAITAVIPIVNISLATKEILAGTIQLPLLALTFFSLVAYATIAVLFSVKWFGRESNILR